MMAVLLLIFRDTILSFVASIQLMQNDMVKVGDWIEMPSAGVDGDVMDIALHTVKVQNFDNTIVTVPTQKLINESFKNWRGMSESGGRRIKRSINIDVSSIRFLTEEEIERFNRFEPLRDYISQKRSELDAQPAVEGDAIGDPRRLTNVGTFRAYMKAYAKANPKIDSAGMTFLVRELQPGPTGLPIEIYIFANDTNWVRYEDIQADIFDHLLAMTSKFGLRVFQQPTGSDIIVLGDDAARAMPEALRPEA
jgi:miniconductance mechanosensitive channel